MHCYCVLSYRFYFLATYVYYAHCIVLCALLLARLMGQYCFAGWRLSSSVVVVFCNVAGGRAGLPPAAWTVGAPATWSVEIRRPTLHGGPVVLRPVRTIPCFNGSC